MRYAYKPTDRGVSVPVSLSAGEESVQLFASLDTGAEYCLFEREFAEALLIELEGGEPMEFSTVTGRFQAYGHWLTLAALDIEVHTLVYFYEDRNIRRNVLGRKGWLNRVRLGLGSAVCSSESTRQP